MVCEAGYRGEHRPTIEALLQNRPEPALPPRSGRGRSSLNATRRGAGATQSGGAAAGGAGGSPSASAAALCE